MKKFFTTLFFTFILMVSLTRAQVGTTIQFSDYFGSCTLSYDSIQNGKYRYKGFGCMTGVPQARFVVFWNFNNWELRRIDDRPSYWATAYISTVETALNPPNLALGNWTVPTNQGYQFSVFSGTGTANFTLPVELLSFIAKNREGNNLLSWTTASEVNNKGFQVERQNEAGNWDNIAFITAYNKASTYTFTDNRPLNTTYYRLRQIDNDGKETLSKVVSVTNTVKIKDLKVYPSVTTGFLTIETTEITPNFQIFNLLGKQVMNGKTTQRLDVSALSDGTYMLKIGNKVAKFVKK